MDLDETLISCTNKAKGDKEISFTYKDKEMTVWINLRPHLFEFLEFAHKNFEIILFSSSHKYYINGVLDLIDKDRKYFKKIIPRKNSFRFDKIYIKNLDILN